MVNSRSFELDYDVTSVGPSGVSRVEVWGTRDAGRSWTRLAMTDGQRSPATVQVDEDGTYGLRLVVQSGSGLTGLTPKSGEAPELWVGVDTTPPTGHIVGVQQQPLSDQASRLAIVWEARDAALAPQPVTLAYSPSPQGPWTKIASGLPAAGTHQWQTDAQVPQRIFLRLEIRDEAGNVGTQTSAEAVVLDRSLPTARIRGIRATR